MLTIDSPFLGYVFNQKKKFSFPFSPAPTPIGKNTFFNQFFLRLWTDESAEGFAGVARVPFKDLLSGNVYVDPFILQSMKKFGFFYVVDVPEYNATVELDYLKRFFELPADQKDDLAIRKHNPANKNAYRGNNYTCATNFVRATFLNV